VSAGPVDRKALIRAYKERPRTMGVYRVVNGRGGRCLLGSSIDAPAALNRQRAQLRMAGHPVKALQRDWDAQGPDSFAFEILDTLEPPDEPGYDPAADLSELESMWRERLLGEGVEMYA